MENDILEILHNIGYDGPILDEDYYAEALKGGPKSLSYTNLVHVLAQEIKKLNKLEETVNLMKHVEESSTFLLELSSFLKELGCPYRRLVTGHMSSRLQTKADRVLLLEYLLAELMAARMIKVDAPEDKSMDIVVEESDTANDLKKILITLKFNKPPPNITPQLLFSKVEAKLVDVISKGGQQLVGKPLYNKTVSEQQWKDLEKVLKEMLEEYRLRRETLITRLECTIQSFEWSDRLKAKKDEIEAAYRPKKEQLKAEPNVKMSDFLAARTSLLQLEKSSSANVRANTECDVNKVIIGKVPDRGGRPNEQHPPPPEMPSWQQRTQAPSSGRGDRGHSGQGGGNQRGGRGGKVQGGYNQNFGDNRQGGRGYQTYEVSPGGYNTHRGGYNQGGFKQSYDAAGSGHNNRNFNDNGSYNSGYNQNSGYQTSGYRDRNQGRGHNQRGYHNEHDDRTNERHGRSNYYRGGRR